MAGDGVNEGDLPDGPWKTIGKRFTEGTAFLKSAFPNPKINKLMSLTWDVVGNKIVPLAIGPDVPSLGVATMGAGLASKSMIFAPHAWVKMIEEDPVGQMGAIVHVGSQVVDAYNRRVLGETRASAERAKAWEAEFLLTVSEMGRGGPWRPNPYQAEILSRYPSGVSSPAAQAFVYEIGTFVKSN